MIQILIIFSLFALNTFLDPAFAAEKTTFRVPSIDGAFDFSKFDSGLKEAASTHSLVDPHTKGEKVAFMALDAATLLGRVFGDKWSDYKFVNFTGSDGYRVQVESADLRSYRSLLAFGIEGKMMFSLKDELQFGKLQDLGPLYLIWDVVRGGKKFTSSTKYWPYQIIELTLSNSSDDLGRLDPKIFSNKSAENTLIARGHKEFMGVCFQCHGLEPGLVLQAPSAFRVLEIAGRHDLSWLTTQIKRPTKNKQNSKMPALNLPRYEIQAISMYLKSLGKNH